MPTEAQQFTSETASLAAAARSFPASRRPTIGFLVTLGVIAAALVWLTIASPHPDATGTEILRIVFDWPFLAATIAIVAGLEFRLQLADLIKNLAWFKFGPVEARRRDEPQPPPPADDGTARHGNPTPTAEPVAQGEVAGVPVDFSAAWETQAYFWWCEYLSQFLAPRTQFILIWLSFQTVAPSKAYVDAFWGPWITNPVEREAILSALWHYDLVTKEQTSLQVTDSGRRFIAHMDQQHPQWRVRADQSMKALQPPLPSSSTAIT